MTSDIGASSGSARVAVSTVSYAMAVVPDSSRASVHAREAARCRYVKSVWPLRRRWYSSATGSFTLSSRSAAAQTSSAVGRIRAPAARYSASGMEEPSPACCSTRTWWP